VFSKLPAGAELVPGAGAGFGADFCARNLGAWMICHVGCDRHAARRFLRRARRRGQRFQCGELPVELIELDCERQEIAAGERAATAQVVQGVLELTRRPFERGELERRRVASHPVDLVEGFLQFGAKRLLLTRRLLEHRIDGLHGRIGPLDQGGKACASPLQNAAQNLALGLGLSLQVLQFARCLHFPGDVGNAHQPQARFAVERMEGEGIMRGVEAPVAVHQPHFQVPERVRIRRHLVHRLRLLEPNRTLRPRRAFGRRRVGRQRIGRPIGARHRVCRRMAGVRVVARRRAEHLREVTAHQSERLGGDQRRHQLLEAQVGEVLAAKQRSERVRNLRLNLALRVQEQDSRFTVLKDRFGDAAARLEQLLLFALVSLCGNEHGIAQRAKRPQRRG
jgi:hypothetical protein